MDSLDTIAGARRAEELSGWKQQPAGEGLVLGRYRLLHRLGAGGFGVVWRARDELLHREVAVKRIPLAPGEDSERAGREALAAARLAHPAIVALYEACAEQGAFYLISELVHGETLAQLIAAGTLADEEVLEIGVALADALAHAHSRGVIHRDVKPHNVLVPRMPEAGGQIGGGSVGVAKLTDFGGARLAGEELLTRTGDVIGTLAYMAPEQSEGHEAGESADLYALALVLYEALTGVNPVRGATAAATAKRIGAPHPSLERARRDLPRALTRALERALLPVPEERGTLEDLNMALEEALEHDLEAERRGLLSARTRIVPRRARTPIREQEELTALPVMEPGGAEDEDSQPAPEPGARLGAWQRIWLGCVLALIAWQLWDGRAGVALLLAAAIAPLAPFALARRRGQQAQALSEPPRRGAGATLWLTAGLAPALGLAGLAGAYPAIAGQAGRWWRRAALGALGYWWLTLAGPLADSRPRAGAIQLWLAVPAGTPARGLWEGSLERTASHVIHPMLGAGVLLGALLWAAAAALLPWIVRGRVAALDVLAAALWSAVLLTAAPVADAGRLAGMHPSAHGALLGALLGATVAVGARALRGPV